MYPSVSGLSSPTHMNIERLLPNNQFINQMPGPFVVLDLNSHFIIANDTALRWTGLKSHEVMIGKTYADMPCKASEEHESFVNQDQAILKNNGYGKIFGIYCYDNDDWKILLAEKYPLKDESGDIAALAVYINDLTHSNIVDVNKFITLTSDKNSFGLNKQQGFLVGEISPRLSLTPRQQECLFFLIRGKTAKGIAETLNVSPRTIEDHIEQLKGVFNCQTKYELIEKTIACGCMSLLPPSLM